MCLLYRFIKKCKWFSSCSDQKEKEQHKYKSLNGSIHWSQSLCPSFCPVSVQMLTSPTLCEYLNIFIWCFCCKCLLFSPICSIVSSKKKKKKMKGLCTVKRSNHATVLLWIFVFYVFSFGPHLQYEVPGEFFEGWLLFWMKKSIEK